jgi:hypothetical protein
MAFINRENLTPDELRRIISGFLDEVLHYYREHQRISLESRGTGSESDQRLEQCAIDLLNAMAGSVDPSARRKAVLQVLSRGKQYREPSLPS